MLLVLSGCAVEPRDSASGVSSESVNTGALAFAREQFDRVRSSPSRCYVERVTNDNGELRVAFVVRSIVQTSDNDSIVIVDTPGCDPGVTYVFDELGTLQYVQRHY